MKRCLTVCAGLFLVGSLAHGDKWMLPPEVRDTEITFGDTRVALHYDSTQDRRFPAYTLKILRGDKLLAEHAGVGYTQVFASPDNAFFLGVSNDGLVKSAYVIFDREGKIVKLQPHDPKKVHYHEMSVSLVRVWYDAKKPEVKFDVADGKLRQVTIRGADGNRVELLEEKP